MEHINKVYQSREDQNDRFTIIGKAKVEEIRRILPEVNIKDLEGAYTGDDFEDEELLIGVEGVVVFLITDEEIDESGMYDEVTF